jgi:GxxExxY protein
MQNSDLTGTVIGCAMRVHSALGNGFQEKIYQSALSIELEEAQVRHIKEFEMPIYYKAHHIGTRRVDLLVEDNLSVELKAIIQLDNVHLAQAMNYLEAYNIQTGLLINFGAPSLQFHRLTNKKYARRNRKDGDRNLG